MNAKACLSLLMSLVLWLFAACVYAIQIYSLQYNSQTADTLYLDLAIYTTPQPMPGVAIANFYYMPWWGVAVDGAAPSWQVTPGYYSHGFEFGSTDYFPIAWPITVEEGFHSFQAYIMPFENAQRIPVGEPLTVYVSDQYFAMLNWELMVISANQQGLNLRLKLHNLTSQTWTMTWPHQPIACFSLNGQMIYGPTIDEAFQLTLYPSLTYYIPLSYNFPLQPGAYRIQAYLILPDGSGLAPVGNLTTVNIGNVQNLQIGAGNLTANQPIDFYWNNSLYECIYTLAQLSGTSINISNLAFFNSFDCASQNAVPVKIYLDATSNNDLLEGWIPSSELSLVYDGLLDFPSGQNEIFIKLDNNFYLPQGQNLVLMVERQSSAGGQVTGANFLGQEAEMFDSRLATTNSTPLDPANPPASAGFTGKTPKIDIYYIPGSEVSEQVNSPILGLSSYPNPFASSSTLRFELKEASPVRLEVYNLKGQKITTLFDGAKPAGKHEFYWDGCSGQGSPVANGIYYIKISSGRSQLIRKTVLIK